MGGAIEDREPDVLVRVSQFVRVKSDAGKLKQQIAALSIVEKAVGAKYLAPVQALIDAVEAL